MDGTRNALVQYHGRPVPRWYVEHVRALVDAAPPLSAEQRQRLAVLMRPDGYEPPPAPRSRRAAAQSRRRAARDAARMRDQSSGDGAAGDAA